MSTKNDSVRFTYETYAKITHVKIRAYISNIKYAPYVRIELWPRVTKYENIRNWLLNKSLLNKPPT